jgi:hypothetical protein
MSTHFPASSWQMPQPLHQDRSIWPYIALVKFDRKRLLLRFRRALGYSQSDSASEAWMATPSE